MLRNLSTHFRRQFVGYLALFVALGGSAYAVTSLPSNSVGTSQLKNSAVTTPKLANGAVTSSKLGAASVGAGKLANGAVTGAKVAANSLTGANINVGTLGTVPNANHLGGSPAAAYARTPAEPFHEVTAFGDKCGDFGAVPHFGTWQNYDSVNNSTAAYFRDPFGIVHLKGTVSCPWGGGPVSGSRIFSVPSGYTPAKTENFAVPGAQGDTSIAIFGNGDVVWVSGNNPGVGYLELDGISFRCEPSGASGCP